MSLLSGSILSVITSHIEVSLPKWFASQVDGPGTCSCIAEPGSGNINADEEVSILDIVLGGEYHAARFNLPRCSCESLST